MIYLFSRGVPNETKGMINLNDARRYKKEKRKEKKRELNFETLKTTILFVYTSDTQNIMHIVS